MAYKAKINPQSGSSSNLITLQLEMDSNIETKIRIENATHSVTIDEFTLAPNEIKIDRQFELKIPEHSSDAMISVFVNIEVKENDKFKLVKVIPLVYHISELKTSQTDVLFDISPSLVSQEDTCKISVKGETGDKYVLSVNDKRFNTIVGPSGFGSIHFKSKDVLVNSSNSTPHRFPVYYYSSNDNYIEKKFTGSYLDIIPNDVLAASQVPRDSVLRTLCERLGGVWTGSTCLNPQIPGGTIPLPGTPGGGGDDNPVPLDPPDEPEEDPRCETYDADTWVPPEGCDDGGDPEDPEEPAIPGNEIPKKICDYDDCANRPCDCESETDAKHTDACRIHKSSSTLLSNGMVLNAYVSVDRDVIFGEDAYNEQRIFIQSDESSLDCQILAAENVAVLPKTADEDFTVYITEELYNTMVGAEDRGVKIMAVFMDENMDYAGFKVTSVHDVSEYFTFHTLIIDRDDSSIHLNELDACVYTVFYEITDTDLIVPPSVELPSNIVKLPFVETGDTGRITATNVSISSDSSYRGPEGESYVHVIAEAYIYGTVQLFYYGFSVGPTGYISTNSDSWTLLTTLGSNKNVQTVTDKYNNLHVFWESNRTGLDQIYYGAIGPSSVFYANATISSIIDKKVAFDKEDDKPFGYLAQDIIQSTGETLERISGQGEVTGIDTNILDEYGVPITEPLTTYPNKGILETAWIKQEKNSGEVTIDDEVDEYGVLLSSNVTVESSTLSETAVAFTKLDRDNFLDLSSGRLSQINYQVSFGFDAEISQDVSGYSVLSQEEIDLLYGTFKSSFTETVDAQIVDGMPFYVLDDNRFSIGKEEEIYDRFIPIMGSYKNELLQDYTEGDTVAEDFTIYASGDNRNLNHYFIAVIPEKIRFKAYNMEDEIDFLARTEIGVYNVEEIQEYYTGRASLAVVYSTDNSLFDYELSDVTIRNISKPFILSEVTNIDILANYSKMFSEDVANYLGVSVDIIENFPRFMCNLSVIVNGSAEFSESFIVNMSDKYRAFDIGLGVTSQGCFKADNFYPYNSSVFENASVVFNYTDITISSPTYQFNSAVCSVPTYTREQLDLSAYDYYGNREDVNEKFFDNYNLMYEDITDVSSGFIGYEPEDVSVEYDEYGVPIDIPYRLDISTQEAFTVDEFMQIPLTLEGINSNPSVSIDFINNIHLTWQSNRNKSWNIFYSCSTDANMPFRFDTRITDTTSSSLSPDVATDADGRRMVVWHDDRDGKYQIYSARALESVTSANEVCETNGILQYLDDDIVQFVTLEFDFSGACQAFTNVHFVIQFYSDKELTQLVGTASSKVDQTNWTVNGIQMTENGASTGDTVKIAYKPDSKTSGFCGGLVYGQIIPVYYADN